MLMKTVMAIQKAAKGRGATHATQGWAHRQAERSAQATSGRGCVPAPSAARAPHGQLHEALPPSAFGVWVRGPSGAVLNQDE